MDKLFFYLLFAALLSCNLSENVFAQSDSNARPGHSGSSRNYTDALVIKQSGDTLRGQIYYKEWILNPYSISFKQLDKGEVVLSAKDINEFRVGGDIYRAEKVDLDISPTDINNLNDTPIPTVIKDTTLFLLVLVQGEVSLYFLRDAANKDHYFYQKAGQPTKELIYYRYYTDTDPVKLKFLTKEIYKGQLKVLSLACKNQQIDTDISYLAEEFVQFFIKLNECESRAVKEHTNHSLSKGRTEFAAIGGVQYSVFNFAKEVNNHYLNYLDYVGSKHSTTPVVGLGVNHVFPRELGRYSLTANLIYSHHRITHIVEGENFERLWRRFDEYQFNAFQLTTLFRYSFPTRNKLRFYIAAGPSLVYYHNRKFYKIIERENFRGEMKPWSSDEFELQPLMARASVAMGTSWKKFAFELLYQREFKNMHSGEGYSNASHFSGLLSYTLFGSK